MRTNVYVDGFNLYYRAIKGTPYKWLDLSQLCRRVLSGRHEIHRIRYFTARIQSRPTDPRQLQRQLIYLRALQTIPNLSIHYGTFLSNTKRMPFANPIPGGPRFVEVISTEEKGSDVNLATMLLCDGFRGDYELAAVISNDSDLALPIKVVRDDLGKPVAVLYPSKAPTAELLRVASFVRPIRQGALAASQFPPLLTDTHGIIHRPPEW